MALGNDGIRPDKLELRIRFVCGFLIGAFAGGTSQFALRAPSPLTAALLAVVAGLAGGVLARHYGDRFWSSVLRWF